MSCIAVTKTGTSCKNKAKIGNLCGVHKNYVDTQNKEIVRIPENKEIAENKVIVKSEIKEISLDYKKLNLELVFQDTAGTLALLKGNFSETQLAIDAFKSINSQMLVNPPIITPFGKEGKQNRSIAFVSDESKGYNYSNQLMPSIKLTDSNKKLLQYVNQYLGSDYNGILWNKYVDGESSLGAHSDDEKNLGKTGVFSITLWFDRDFNIVQGVGRTFRVHNKKTDINLLFQGEIKNFGSEQTIYDVELQHGESLLMFGNFQKMLKHSIPVRKRVKYIRVSATFRKHLE